MADFNIKAYYRNLARVFSAGPSVPQRIANKMVDKNEFIKSPGQPGGGISHTTFNDYTLYANQASNSNRMSRYGEYTSMETMAEIASTLDIFAEETCTKGEFGEVLKIESPNSLVKERLTDLFYDTLNIEFNCTPWVRSLCKYGDLFLKLDHHPNYGITSASPLPINEITREEGFDKEHPNRYQFKWQNRQNMVIEPWQVAHFRLLGNDHYLPYGMSVLEPARRAWRQLTLMEDAVMVYRIVRSPERRVFYIDVGNIAPNDVAAFMEQTKNALKRNQIVDPSSGQVDQRYNPMSVADDFFLAVRGNESATKIDTLPGGQFVSDVDDLLYIQNKLFAALKVPKSYLGYEGDVGGKSVLSNQDVRFARSIQHIQRVFLAELEKIAMIHLYSVGYRDQELKNFSLRMANPSTINEIQRLEVWRTKFEVASVATGQDGVLDKDFIYRHIFGLNAAEIESIEEGRRKDRVLQLELEALGTEPVAAEAEAANDEVQNNAEPGSIENTTEPMDDNGVGEGRDPNKQVAIPNALKGRIKKRRKSALPQSTLKQIYNLKKNGMDPEKDLQVLRRHATAPFGESSDGENNADQVFDSRVRMLSDHSETLAALERNQSAYSSKKKVLK